MFKYEGQICPVCHAKFFEDDEIAVCPDCGAPHHRDCYTSFGKCAYTADHNTPHQWKPAKRAEDPKEKPICKNCGAGVLPDSVYCPYCGTPIKGEKSTNDTGNSFPFGQNPFLRGGFEQSFDPLGGVDPTETIEDIPVDEVASFVAANTNRYIPVFINLTKPKKRFINWNWAAFLLPECWLFYRKCYKPGILAAFLSIAAILFNTPLLVTYNNIIGRLPAENYTQQQLVSYFLQNLSQVSNQTILFTLIGLLIMLASRVLFALFGDFLYKEHSIKKIRSIRTKHSGSEARTEMAKEGSANMFYAMGAYMLVNFIASLLQTFILN